MSHEIQELDHIIGRDNFINKLLQNSVALTSLSNEFPGKEEMQFHKKIPSTAKIIKDVNKKILECIQTIGQFIESPMQPNGITLKYSSVLDSTDKLLENVDVTLDKIRKVNTDTNIQLISQPQQVISSSAKDIEKPQKYFKDVIDNSKDTPFLPKIKEKTNAKAPLSHLITSAQSDFAAFVKTLEDPKVFAFPHPYEHEIETLEYSPDALAVVFEPQQPVALTEENLLFVDSYESLQQLISHLRQGNYKELAVDLEHHHIRSYQGFTCLMQLSTRVKDFIIDVIKLREHMYLLNEFFTDPKITKVLHGADSDILWLQKDFGIYVVNMFDTGQASRFLKLPAYSLAHLLMKYCKVSANKQYQLADWRVRPLPRDLIKYAREDTHYLLYIYDMIRKDIIKFAIEKQTPPEEYIKSVLNSSKDITLQCYRKPIVKDNDYYSILNRQKQIYSSAKFRIFKKLWKWRDFIARSVDENSRYIMPNNVLFDLINKQPKTVVDLYKCFKALSAPVKTNVQSLIDVLNSEMEVENSQTEIPEVKASTSSAIKKSTPKRFEVEQLEPEELPAHVELSQKKFKLIEFETSIYQPTQNNSKENTTSVRDKVLGFADAFGIQEGRASREAELNEVENQFKHMSLIDTLLSFYPHISKEKIQKKIQENARKEQEIRMKELTQTQIVQANVKEAEERGMIEFEKDTTEQQLAELAQRNKKPLRLDLKSDKPTTSKKYGDEEEIEFVKPNRDKQNNRRRRDRNLSAEEAKFNSKVKKIKVARDEAIRIEKMDNQFESINNGDSSEEEHKSVPMKSSFNYKKEANKMRGMWEQLSSKDFVGDPMEIVSSKFENQNKNQPKKRQDHQQRNQQKKPAPRMKPPRQR